MVQSTIFTVNDEPYCIWEVNISERNNEFLNGIDTEYFDYLLKVHLEAEDEKRAAIALRSTLHHATETLFLLLGAYIQAPNCAYAWIAKCSNTNLREMIQGISSGYNTLFTKLNIDHVSWDSVAQCVFHCYEPNTEKRERTSKLFASFWSSIGSDFTSKEDITEYNSIKHGFRIRPGGFTLAMGVEHEYGVSPPESEMKVIVHSEHGATYFKIDPVDSKKGNRSLRSRKVSINWSIQETVLKIQLVAMSINNVVSALKIANGAKAGTCKFTRPQGDSDFLKPWDYGPGVTSSGIDYVINEKDIISTTKNDLLNELSKYNNKRNKNNTTP